MSANFRWGLIGIVVAAGVATLVVSQWPWANAAHRSTARNEAKSNVEIPSDPEKSVEPPNASPADNQNEKGAAKNESSKDIKAKEATAAEAAKTPATNVSTKVDAPPAPPKRDLPQTAPPARKSFRETVRFEKGAEPAEEANGKPRNITFDDLKFPWEDPKSRLFKRTMLTESIEKLNGKKIKVRGFILPTSTTNLRNFVLVRDNMECCFGPGAALYDCVVVDMAAGKTATFTIRPIAVEGTFTVKEWVAPDGKHLSIYHIEATDVQ